MVGRLAAEIPARHAEWSRRKSSGRCAVRCSNNPGRLLPHRGTHEGGGQVYTFLD